ncbi:MAG: GntR family transcriptional regulator [Sporomusa sp.]
MGKSNSKEKLRERLNIGRVRKGAPLYIEAYRKIRELIVDGTFANGDKLISEAELADMLQIGRTSLRTAFALLYEDGYLKTYQGKGTYVIYEPSEHSEKFPEHYIMPRQRLERIADTIYILNDQLRMNSYDAFLSEILETNKDNIMFFQRTYSLDNKVPALVMQTYIPVSRYPELKTDDPDELEKLLHKFLKEKVNHVTFRVVLPLADTIGRKNFDSTREPFSLITMVWRDAEGNPLIFSKDYYNDNVVRFSATLTV